MRATTNFSFGRLRFAFPCSLEIGGIIVTRGDPQESHDQVAHDQCWFPQTLASDPFRLEAERKVVGGCSGK